MHWGNIDRAILRAIGITFLVVITARVTSTLYDRWMDDRQDEMIANQAALAEHVKGRVAEENEANTRVLRETRCLELVSADPCVRPKDLDEAGDCVRRLARARCGELPHIQLCVAVEEIEACADPFEDQDANGCNRMRRSARCQKRPAPEQREGLWTFRFDDGLWQGD